MSDTNNETNASENIAHENNSNINNEVKTVDIENEAAENIGSPKDNSDAKHEGYLGYYAFVFISAILGFIAAFFLSRIGIVALKESGKIDLTDNKTLISCLVALVAVIIFMFIALGLKEILKKIFLSELFLYLYMGFLTTVVNIVAFELLKDKFSANMAGSSSWKIAEILAFIIGVIFAFVTNKIFVFKSLSIDIFKLFSEFGMFIGARLITEGINFFIMWIMIDKNGMNESLTKIIASVVVIILNYIFSKYIIFKKKKNEIV